MRRAALVTDVGVRLPAHLTATGRAMLAALPRPQVRALYPDASAFTLRTGRGPTRPSELRELLRAVRTAGYASEDGEVTDSFSSVGVAVHDHTGWPVAAIAVTWETPVDASTDDRDVTEIVAEMKDRARELERSIGSGAVGLRSDASPRAPGRQRGLS